MERQKTKTKTNGVIKDNRVDEYKRALCPFTSKLLGSCNQHMKTHSSEKPFKCPELNCPFRTKHKQHVKRHINDVHLFKSPSSRPFPCPHPGCSYAGNYKSILKKHSKIQSDEKPFSCSHPNCSYSAKYETYLVAHTRVHTGEKLFACQFESCSYASTTSSSLLVHSRTHTKERPFKCPEPNCQYAAARNSHLKQHQLVHQPNEGEEKRRPSFTCPIQLCEFSTNYKTNLRQHIKTHSVEKPFACSVESCEFRCKMKAHLSAHLKRHSEERRYKCQLCPFRGKTRAAVKNHLKNVHSQLRPFKCTQLECDYAAKNKAGLKKHLLVHRGEKKYSCFFHGCAYRAIAKYQVKGHEDTFHSEEKKEKCPICDFKCKSKSNLNNHFRTHTNEEPFVCKEEGCEYRTKHSSSFTRHQKKHPLSIFKPKR